MQKSKPRREMEQIQSMAAQGFPANASALVVSMPSNKLSEWRRQEYHKNLRSRLHWDVLARRPSGGALDKKTIANGSNQVVELEALVPAIWLLNVFKFRGYHGLSQEELYLLRDTLHPASLPGRKTACSSWSTSTSST